MKLKLLIAGMLLLSLVVLSNGCSPTFKEGTLNLDRFPTTRYYDNCDELGGRELICDGDLCCCYIPIIGEAKCCKRNKT